MSNRITKGEGLFGAVYTDALNVTTSDVTVGGIGFAVAELPAAAAALVGRVVYDADTDAWYGCQPDGGGGYEWVEFSLDGHTHD